MKREILKWTRTIHICLSLSAFAMFLFFAVTGVMLTHDSFGLDRVTGTQGSGMIAAATARSEDEAAIVAGVRSAFHIQLPVTKFTPDEDQVEVDFAGPSRRAQVIIRRADGMTEVNYESRGFVGLMADLHKGAETGWAWRALLDVVSMWIALSSITGIIMLLALPKRMALGLAFAVLGTLVTIATYAIYVPK